MSDHLAFIDSLNEDKRERCYTNDPHGFPVKTRQETALKINRLKALIQSDDSFISEYEE